MIIIHNCFTMMKRSAIVCFTIIVLLAISCKKENNNTEYQIDGIVNQEARVYDTLVMNLQLKQTNGDRENVTLSLKDVPQGITYSFSTPAGQPDYATNLSIIVTDKVDLGDSVRKNYTMKLVVANQSTSQEFDFNLYVSDTLSMTMTVYDASLWTLQDPAGELSSDALIKLYRDEASAKSEVFFHSTVTDSVGVARFYHVTPGTYYFTVEKGSLSNISSKTLINGLMLGFATVNVDRKTGVLEYRDQDGDKKFTDADRVKADMLMLYYRQLSEKLIWIGN
jgi:hypothetical protein